MRQAVSLCDHQNSQDMHARDKFIFGLDSDIIRTELLKTHLKSDGRPKTVSDVAAEAKALETAQKASKLISDNANKTSEDVHWTKQKQPRLKRERGTCYRCGDPRGPHSGYECPAREKICANCGLSDHFARVCLDTPRRIPPRPRGKGSRGRAMQDRTSGRDSHRQQRNQEVRQLDSTDQSLYHTDEYIDDTDDTPDDFSMYALDMHSVHNVITHKSAQHYNVNLPVSSTGASFMHMKFQIDTAATCNMQTTAEADTFTIPALSIWQQ